ncbi:MAG: hypothetical protein H6728_13325 [Myxococcales bacterium]|nr:hypothetical protein [Myxococcales bacterium]MCB9644050.1 hypothetical protein [Myxococcales bacterium]
MHRSLSFLFYPTKMDLSSRGWFYLSSLFVLSGSLLLWDAAPSLAAPPTSRPTTATSQPTPPPKPQPTSQPAPRAAFTPVPPPPKPAHIVKRNQATQRLIFRVSQLLGLHIQDFALDPKNPWLLAHALLAMGPQQRLSDGRLVMDVLVGENLQYKKFGKLSLLGFPKGPKKQYIEAHPHLFLQILSQLKTPLDRKFSFKGKQITLRDIFNSALYQFPYQAKGPALSQMSWLLLAMRGNMPSNLWHWRNAEGKQINLFRTMWRLFIYLDRLTVFLRTLQMRDVKEIPKNKLRNQYIYKEIYGGFYLLRASLAWLDHPLLRQSKKLKLLSNAQIELLFYRYLGESKLYQRIFQASQKNLGQRFLILMQQIRFTSHWLKTIVEAHKRKQFELTKAYKRDVRSAIQLLCVSVLILDRLGFFQKKRLERMRALNAQGRRFVIDLIADAAHARHALVMLQTAPDLYLD